MKIRKNGCPQQQKWYLLTEKVNDNSGQTKHLCSKHILRCSKCSEKMTRMTYLRKSTDSISTTITRHGRATANRRISRNNRLYHQGTQHSILPRYLALHATFQNRGLLYCSGSTSCELHPYGLVRAIMSASNRACIRSSRSLAISCLQ